eukprot:2083909-Lingulodinium_polyedra.AAC.1
MSRARSSPRRSGNHICIHPAECQRRPRQSRRSEYAFPGAFDGCSSLRPPSTLAPATSAG